MKNTNKPPMKNSVRVKQFMNSDFKSFSLADNRRSIPDIRDGLKPSQRKAVYGFLVRGENAAEMPVERLAAAVAASTDYHHGTGSMESTIISMANKYPGSNNVHLFLPSGQFGSRLTKDAASARYVMSCFSENFRKIFKKDDDLILKHLESDGGKIEPECFIPLLPMVLVNGSTGTGTGHSTNIMNYNPEDLKTAVANVIAGKKLVPGTLVPWYRGFNGKIIRQPETGQVIIEGAYVISNTTTIRITELPIGTYLDPYKEHLQKLEDQGVIKDFEDHSTEDAFEFILNVPRSTTQLDHDTIMKKFKLVSRDTENLTVWGVDGLLRRYESVEEIIETWVPWRLEQYEARRTKLIEIVSEQIRFASEKYRFIEFYLNNTDEFKNRKKVDLISLLTANDFIDYDKLLGMQIWNLTHDKIQELKKEIDNFNKQLIALQKDTGAAMYKRELTVLSF